MSPDWYRFIASVKRGYAEQSRAWASGCVVPAWKAEYLADAEKFERQAVEIEQKIKETA